MMLKFLPKFLLAVISFFALQNLQSQTVLPLNGSASGSITTPGDTATYSLTTNADGAINLTLSVSNNQATYVSLYDSDKVTVLDNPTYTYNGPLAISIDGLAKGKYYVKVYPYFSSGTPSFTVSNTLTVAVPANDKEPNNTPALADVLTLNDSTTGHIGYYYNHYRDSADWYKVTTNADGLLRLRLNVTDNQPIYCALYDHDGVTVLAGPTYTYNTVDINKDGLAAGTYYVKIYAYDVNNGFAPYTLSDSLFTTGIENDIEPNNTLAQSGLLTLDGSTTGHIGYYYNHYRDSADWYKVTTNADGLLRLRLTVTDNQPIYCTLYDHDGVTILGGPTYTYNTIDINTDGLAAGTYYVKINAYDVNNGFAPYTLSDSLFTPVIGNDKEPNNTPAQADLLTLNDSTNGQVGYYYNHYRDTADWYKVTTNADGLLRLRLNVANNTAVYCALYDKDGVTILGGPTYTYNIIDVNTDGLAAGTYYVKIYCYSDNQFAPYTLSDSLFTYNPNDSEPNGYAAKAVTIPANRIVTGHVGFYYNNYRDTTDWWKINYTGTSGTLNLTFNVLPLISNGSTNPAYFEVYTDTSAAPIFSQYTYGNLIANLTGLTQGYYYIKVFEYSNSQFEVYSIADTFMQVNIAQININTSKTTINSSTCGADSITYNLSGSHSPYTVRFYKNGVLSDSIKTTAASATFKGLSAGNYYATVYGDGATDSAYSKSATSTATPPVPTALTTSGIGVHTATLNWTKLSCVNYYKVQYRAVGSTTWIVVNTIGDTSKLALTGLSPYTLYAWEVESVDTTKSLTFTSAFADSTTFRTLSDTAHIALTFKGAGSGCNNDTLIYTSTNSEAPYTVTLYRNGVAYGSPLSVTSIASYLNVPPGNYYAKSTGTGSGGSFGLSATTQILPPAPTGLDTTMVTPATATLNWDAVSCSNYYTVQYKVTGTTTWTSVNAATNNAALIGLIPNTKYTWHVSASDSFNNQTVTSAYSDTATFMTSSILPVTFVSFSAVLNNGNALLSWSTANEINNKGFNVERSNDGSHFNSIGFVDARYGHSILDYSFTDNNIINGSDYYRLKQIDVDGNYMYSRTIKLDLSKFAWSINGNPVINNNSNIQLKLDHAATVSVQIISLNGSILQTIHKGTINAGNYTIPLRLNNVSAGIYIIKLMVDKQSYTSTIMKQ